MKKIWTILLLLCFILTLSACGKKASTDTTPPNTAETSPQTVPATTAPTQAAAVTETQPALLNVLSYDQQADLIWKLASVWQLESFSEYERYWYTFTDLDHNGRMEVLGAITQGTGIFTRGTIWEVSEDFTSLTEVYSSEDLPELILSSMVCYEDPVSGVFHYCCTNSTRITVREYGSQHLWISLDQGQWKETEIASVYQTYEPNREEYTDSNGPITQDDFENAFARAGAGMKRSDVFFHWVHDDELTDAQAIRDTFQVFTGARRHLRDPQAELYFFIEGMPELVPATLFAGQDYSIYIPKEGWHYTGIRDSGVLTDTWTSIYNDQVQLRILKLEDFSLSAAQSRYPEYDMILDQQGGLGGMDSGWKHIIDIRIVPVNESHYIIAALYPTEAAEGFGARLSAMVDTFALG